MQYCSVSDMDDMMFGVNLLAPDPPYTASGIQAAINRASAEVDSYLASRYKVPFAAVPDDVRYLTAEMAIYYLQLAKGVERVTDADSQYEKRYNYSLQRLSDWRDSRVHPQLKLLDQGVPFDSNDVAYSRIGAGGVLSSVSTPGRDS